MMSGQNSQSPTMDRTSIEEPSNIYKSEIPVNSDNNRKLEGSSGSDVSGKLEYFTE